ncbi:hypothetical protein PoB_005147500 [Plakobranchus ocellatus]|uniref:Uncharacterized protein n=1 Tax=Plakobranchus ocellatus TaxID=259542 RepID=A0AAV4BX33_9GAST|nr:hypothetical protein PoB_005147500 [Plakobranchus ocellatus]
MTVGRGVMELRQAHHPHCTQGIKGWPYMLSKEKQSNGKKVCKAVEPQPASEDVFTLRRNYSKHAHSNDYVRRVTWLEKHERNAFMSIEENVQVLIHIESLQILNALVHTFGCNHRSWTNSKKMSVHRSRINCIG